MKLLLVALAVALLLTPLAFYGCSAPQESEGFAIYLTRDDVPVAEMEKLSHVAIADEPIVSIDDIIAYNKNNHQIELTAESYERVMSLQVPTSGKSFLVCVDKAPVYWGAFWTPLSSQSFGGVIIFVPPFPFDEFHPNTVRLELGYPGPGFFTKEDPRSNPLIMEALEKAGKLY